MSYNKIAKKREILKYAGALAILQILSLPVFTLAAPPVGAPYVSIPTSGKVNIDTILGKIGNYFFGIVIVACVFMVLWAAFDIATAGDNSIKVEGAKKRIIYALVGLIVAALAGAIVGLVRNIVGA